MRVLFWDIDGTLLTTGGAGLFAWEDALRETGGATLSLQTMHTAGLTDVHIAVEILRRCGLPDSPEHVAALVKRYEELLPSRLHLRTGKVMPGVRELLESLSSGDEFVNLLLTGNTAAGAQAKLSYYDLGRYFRGGAYAEVGLTRNDIAVRALALAQTRFRLPPGEAVYVIGDTPHDIACGAAIGARTIAVATGPHPRKELETHGPWWAIDSLPAPEAFIRRITGSAVSTG